MTAGEPCPARDVAKPTTIRGARLYLSAVLSRRQPWAAGPPGDNRMRRR